MNQNSKSFESIDLKIDIETLQADFQRFVLKHEITKQIIDGHWAFGGWSVLSTNGEVSDGFSMGHLAIDNESGLSDGVKSKELGMKPIETYNVPTEICKGEIKQVIDKASLLGLQPLRARVTMLRPFSQSAWHRDAAANNYMVRLHVPIFTHPMCLFNYEELNFHMPADGQGYFVRVDQVHMVNNPTGIPRIHLIMDVTDTRHITKNFRYNPESPYLKDPYVVNSNEL